jgi:hypothetical protein
VAANSVRGVIVQGEGVVLQSDKIPDIGTRSLLAGQKFPVRLGKEFLQQGKRKTTK